MSACSILRLPDEVLEEVIHGAAAWSDDAENYGFYELYAGRAALARVCRRFHVLAQPILYSCLALGPVHPRVEGERGDAAAIQLGNSIARLLRTVQENPRLARLCVELVIDVEACFEHLNVLCTLIASLSRTRSLRIRHGFKEVEFTATWACLSAALANMRDLEHLAFTAGRRPMNMQHVVAMLRTTLTVERYPGIKELELVGVNRSVLPVRIELWGQKPSQRAPFTKLTLSDYHEESQTIRQLLSAPARLEHFTYRGIRRFGYHPLDLRTLWSYLVPHAPTLETLRVGSLSHQVPGVAVLTGSSMNMLAGIDFAPFERLRSLSLSYWATGVDDGGAAAGASSLLAPRLERFEWVFDSDDGRALYLDHFSRREADFLRRLARTAAERAVPLRRIAVVYSPAAVFPLKVNLLSDMRLDAPPSTADELAYPWDRLDGVAAEVRGLGVELTYNRPSVTRDQFEEAARAYREAVAPRGQAQAGGVGGRRIEDMSGFDARG